MTRTSRPCRNKRGWPIAQMGLNLAVFKMGCSCPFFTSSIQPVQRCLSCAITDTQPSTSHLFHTLNKHASRRHYPPHLPWLRHTCSQKAFSFTCHALPPLAKIYSIQCKLGSQGNAKSTVCLAHRCLLSTQGSHKYPVQCCPACFAHRKPSRIYLIRLSWLNEVCTKGMTII